MESVGQYRVVRELGSGSTARVYLAHDQAGKEVCLKVFHQHLCSHPSLLQRIHRELKLSASLDHENIVRVRDIVSETPPILVMDYVAGESLEVFQARLPYVLPEISVLVAIEVLKALEHAHEKNIVHRDLKPENILVSADRVYVVDFGLAKIIDGTAITQATSLIGSPDFMSPEQCTGDRVDASSDIFSLASILYFLMTGSRPFHRESVMATIHAIKNEAPEPIGQLNPKTSRQLQLILEKGLAKSKEERFASAKEFRQALELYLASVGIHGSGFTLFAWLKSPSHATMELLANSSEHLIGRSEEAARGKDAKMLLECISLLAQKAPSSPAVKRLNRLYDDLNQVRRKKAYLRGGIAAALLLVLVGVGYRQFRPTPVVDAIEPAIPATVSLVNAPEKTGRVKISVPAGTKVYWDGVQINPSKALIKQKPGMHEMVISRPGFDENHSFVNVKAGETVTVKVR